MKNNTSRKLLLFISLAVAFFTILSSIITNLLTGSEDVRTWLRVNEISTTKLIVGTIAIGIALLLLTYLQNKYWQSHESNTGDIEPDVNRLFDSLRERYQNRYQSKLDGRFEITLEVSENFDSQNPQRFIERYAEDAKISEAFTAINNALEKKGRLLIVGNPGVGKTVLLLKLALNLLYKTDLAQQEAFPVIFNLASWSYRYKNFEAWLITSLVSGYGLSEDFATKLLHERRIILLLDGLDELARNAAEKYAHHARAACLASLNDYLRRGRKAVICCRRAEFIQMQNKTGQDAPVSAKIEVLDLTKAEIVLALLHAQENEENSAAANNLLKIIETNETFLEVLSTPFYFTTALEIFDKQIWLEKDILGNLEKVKKYLLNRFVETKLKHSANPNNFQTNKTIKWLKWLAKKLDKDNLILFELANLQHDDVEKTSKSFSIGKDFYLNITVSILLLSFLGNWKGTLGSIIYMVVWSAFFQLVTTEIMFRTEDIVSLDLSRFLKWDFWTELSLSIIKTLPIGLFFGFLGSVLFLLSPSIRLLFHWEVAKVIALHIFLTSIIAGIISGVIITSLERLKKRKEFSSLEYPYQRLFGGFSINLFFSVFVTLLFLVGLWLYDFYLKNSYFHDEIYLILFLFPLSFTVSILSSSPLFRHILLRIDLYRENKMPLKYATFLDYAASLRILEKDGGHWRFRQQNLQEHFAALDSEVLLNKRRKSLIGLIKKFRLKFAKMFLSVPG